jgi:hypothetical protein
MVDYKEVILPGKFFEWEICKFLETSFLPNNLHLRMQFREALAKRDERSIAPTMAPGDTL